VDLFTVSDEVLFFTVEFLSAFVRLHCHAIEGIEHRTLFYKTLPLKQ